MQISGKIVVLFVQNVVNKYNKNEKHNRFIPPKIKATTANK